MIKPTTQTYSSQSESLDEAIRETESKVNLFLNLLNGDQLVSLTAQTSHVFNPVDQLVWHFHTVTIVFRQ